MRSTDERFIDVEPNINAEFERWQDYFETQAEKVINVERLIELELESCYDQRYASVPPQHVYYDSDISLREYFNSGWDLSERGLGVEIPRTLYLWGKEALAKIEAKYKDEVLREDYYARLNKLAIEEFIHGSATAKYYHWLIMKQKKFDLGNSSKPKAGFGKRIAEPESFDDLFIRKELIDDCIQLLREADAINEGNQYIGKSKGVIKVWYDALKNKQFLKTPLPSDTVVIALLQKKFKGFTVDESSFRKANIRAVNAFKKHFELELSHIKTK